MVRQIEDKGFRQQAFDDLKVAKLGNFTVWCFVCSNNTSLFYRNSPSSNLFIDGHELLALGHIISLVHDHHLHHLPSAQPLADA